MAIVIARTSREVQEEVTTFSSPFRLAVSCQYNPACRCILESQQRTRSNTRLSLFSLLEFLFTATTNATGATATAAGPTAATGATTSPTAATAYTDANLESGLFHEQPANAPSSRRDDAGWDQPHDARYDGQ